MSVALGETAPDVLPDTGVGDPGKIHNERAVVLDKLLTELKSIHRFAPFAHLKGQDSLLAADRA